MVYRRARSTVSCLPPHTECVNVLTQALTTTCPSSTCPGTADTEKFRQKSPRKCSLQRENIRILIVFEDRLGGGSIGETSNYHMEIEHRTRSAAAAAPAQPNLTCPCLPR
eukprot:5150196-Prymnesium_polylepis.1